MAKKQDLSKQLNFLEMHISELCSFLGAKIPRTRELLEGIRRASEDADLLTLANVNEIDIRTALLISNLENLVGTGKNNSKASHALALVKNLRKELAEDVVQGDSSSEEDLANTIGC